jgi:Domain of unknown function (DUF1906)
VQSRSVNLEGDLVARLYVTIMTVAALVASFFAAVGLSQRDEPDATVFVAAGQVRSDAKGLDKCNAPTHSQMDAFWSGTSWYWWAIYIGGSVMGCANTNVTQPWINQEVNNGWRLLFVWVGPQAPCTNFSDTFPTNQSDAYDRGYSVAENAFSHASIDLNLNLDNLPLVYDLENFDTSNTACLNAAKAFMRGWTAFLHLGSTQQKSGLYGSVCGSGLDSFWTIAPSPDFIWGGYWNDNPDTGDLSCVGSSHWTNVRHKQYTDDVSRTANGVTLVHLDLDCSRGPIYGNSDTPTNPACQ